MSPRPKGRKPGGQPAVSSREKVAISERLRRCLKEILNAETYEDFAKTIGVPRPTLTRWFGRPPTTPATAHVLALAKEANIQPTWLLLGEGPELRGGTATLSDLGMAIRAHIEHALANELEANPLFVEAVLPSGTELLGALVEQCRPSVARAVAERRALDRLNSPLAKALAMHEDKRLRPILAAIQTSLLEPWQERLTALPPVEPPLTVRPYGPPLELPRALGRRS